MSIFWDNPAAQKILLFKHCRENLQEIEESLNNVRKDYNVYPCGVFDYARGGVVWASVNVEEFAIKKINAESKLLHERAELLASRERFLQAFSKLQPGDQSLIQSAFMYDHVYEHDQLKARRLKFSSVAEMNQELGRVLDALSRELVDHDLILN